MNKTEFIESMVKKGLTKKEAETAVKAYQECITEALVNGDKIQFVGYGTYEVRARAERAGRNPSTKAEIVIPATTYPVFSFGKPIKETVALGNKKKLAGMLKDKQKKASSTPEKTTTKPADKKANGKKK